MHSWEIQIYNLLKNNHKLEISLFYFDRKQLVTNWLESLYKARQDNNCIMCVMFILSGVFVDLSVSPNDRSIPSEFFLPWFWFLLISYQIKCFWSKNFWNFVKYRHWRKKQMEIFHQRSHYTPANFSVINEIILFYNLCNILCSWIFKKCSN